MSGQERIAEYKKQQYQLDIAATVNPQSNAELAAKKGSLELDKKIADEEAKLAKAREDAQKQSAELAKKLVDIQHSAREMAIERLKPEEQLTALIKERNELLRHANKTTDTGLENLHAALNVQEKINGLHDKQKAQKDQTKQQKADDLKTARADEAEAKESALISKMTPEQRQKHAKQKQDMAWYEADKAERKGDPETAAKKRAEAYRLQSQVNDGTQEKLHPSVRVDSLQAVGGGGGIAQSGMSKEDKSLQQLSQQTKILQSLPQAIASALHGTAPKSLAHPK
jgi:hypothetical protein